MAILSLPAKAEEAFYFKPYLGLEYQHTVVDYASISGINFDDVYEDSFDGGAVYLGARIHEFMGLELGYSNTSKSENDNVLETGTKTSLELESFTLDLLGHYPVDEEKKLELIGSIGLAHTKAKAEIDATALGLTSARDEETETQIRFGIGAQYEFAQDWNMRGMVRWQEADFEGIADGAYVFGLGMHYMF